MANCYFCVYTCVHLLNCVRFDSLLLHGLLPNGLPVHPIFQARILEWVAISFSRGSSQSSRIEPSSLVCPALAAGFFTACCTTWEVPIVNYINFLMLKDHSGSTNKKVRFGGLFLKKLTKTWENYLFPAVYILEMTPVLVWLTEELTGFFPIFV